MEIKEGVIFSNIITTLIYYLFTFCASQSSTKCCRTSISSNLKKNLNLESIFVAVDRFIILASQESEVSLINAGSKRLVAYGEVGLVASRASKFKVSWSPACQELVRRTSYCTHLFTQIDLKSVGQTDGQEVSTRNESWIIHTSSSKKRAGTFWIILF